MAAADYWSQAQIDPAYLAAHGGNKQSLISAILGYGDSSQLSPALAAQYGIGAGDVSAANANPYSTQANLAKTLSADQYGITNAANAHGALYSGAHAAAQLGEVANAGQRNYTAQQALAAQIAGINQNDTSALTTAYGTIATNALNTPTPAAVTPDTASAVAPAAVGSTPQTQTWATNPSGFNAGAPQNLPGLAPIKPPKLPKLATGLQGHL